MSDTLQARPEARSLPPNAGVKHLTQRELGIVLALQQEGKTQTQIAQALDCCQQTVSRALSRLGTDSTRLAKHHAKSSAYRTVRRLDRIAQNAKTKDADAIKASAKLLEVAELTGVNGAPTIQNNILIAQPGDPRTWGAGPTLTGESGGAKASDVAPITVQSSESLSNS